jgi:hypothetical protein
MEQQQTLDIDFYNYFLTFNQQTLTQRILNKILKCPDLKKLEWRYSSSGNGIHVRLICLKKCCICRMAFDDQKRLMYDVHYRRSFEQNVLWNKKAVQKNNVKFIVSCSRWHRSI